jgi:hypothetical protein
MAGADVQEKAVGHVREHPEDHPLVLADLRRVGRTSDCFLEGERQRLQNRQVTAFPIGCELLAGFGATRAHCHDRDRRNDRQQHEKTFAH